MKGLQMMQRFAMQQLLAVCRQLPGRQREAVLQIVAQLGNHRRWRHHIVGLAAAPHITDMQPPAGAHQPLKKGAAIPGPQRRVAAAVTVAQDIERLALIAARKYPVTHAQKSHAPARRATTWTQRTEHH